jgi:leucyl-tRNA synthetase
MPEDERPAFRRHFIDFKRLAYVAEMPVWWCEQLGTVLANEEVIDGKSEVGDYPVVRKPMRQWMLRITAYAERLLQDPTPSSGAIHSRVQRNWIGRSEGAEVDFLIAECGLRWPIAWPHSCVHDSRIRSSARRHGVGAGAQAGGSNHHTGVSRGCPCLPGAGRKEVRLGTLNWPGRPAFYGCVRHQPGQPGEGSIWIADYVLASYGTGTIMAVRLMTLVIWSSRAPASPSCGVQPRTRIDWAVLWTKACR